MNPVAAAALIVLALMGSVAHQHSVERSKAVIYYENGYTARVTIINYGDSFCPSNCGVWHRHRVHDIRWSCSPAVDCGHFTVFHVIYRGADNRIAALEQELRESDYTVVSSPNIIASRP